jgi:hypothetical protein
MGKATKKSKTQQVIDQALRVAFETGRFEWLSGRAPMTPMVLVPPTPAAAKPKPQQPASTKAKIKKEGPKERHVNLIARDFWRPNGKPPANLSNAEIVKKVGDVYQKQHGRTVDRTTILRSRTIGRLPRR